MLDNMPPDEFRAELRDSLTSFYEGVLPADVPRPISSNTVSLQSLLQGFNPPTPTLPPSCRYRDRVQFSGVDPGP